MNRSGPDEETRALVLDRDGHRCALCGEVPDYVGYSLQHRRARGMGGTRQGDVNSPANLILLCGSGTTGCHGYVESSPMWATSMGYRVAQGLDPAEMPVRTWRGWIYLNPNGTWREAKEPHDPSEAA